MSNDIKVDAATLPVPFVDPQAVRGTTNSAGQDHLRLSHLSRKTSGRLRRSTLVTLRWTAVAGQAATLVIVSEVLDFSYPYLPAAIIVMLAALVNLGVTFALPLDRRVGTSEAISQLGFDTLQLASLLWFTGGMDNPFVLLFVAPVVTGATTLSKRVLFSIGGLAAAAAHELGTPLATMQLVANEMARELDPNTDMGEDAALLVQQAKRCRDILKQLGARGDKGEMMHDVMRLQSMLEEASEPYFGLGSQIEIKTYGEGQEPDLRRQAEILYGLKNYIENAVEFAESRVTLTGAWTREMVSISIEDDGPGFSAAVRARLGEPYVSDRGDANKTAGGLGLGFFIAKTLIERTGGAVSFDNHPRSGGAFITLTWPIEKIAV